MVFPRRDGPELKFRRGRRPPEREEGRDGAHSERREPAFESYLLSAAVLEEGLLSGMLAVELDSVASFECPLPFAELSE